MARQLGPREAAAKLDEAAQVVRAWFLTVHGANVAWMSQTFHGCLKRSMDVLGGNRRLGREMGSKRAVAYRARDRAWLGRCAGCGEWAAVTDAHPSSGSLCASLCKPSRSIPSSTTGIPTLAGPSLPRPLDSQLSVSRWRRAASCKMTSLSACSTRSASTSLPPPQRSAVAWWQATAVAARKKKRAASG